MLIRSDACFIENNSMASYAYDSYPQYHTPHHHQPQSMTHVTLTRSTTEKAGWCKGEGLMVGLSEDRFCSYLYFMILYTDHL